MQIARLSNHGLLDFFTGFTSLLDRYVRAFNTRVVTKCRLQMRKT